MQAIDRHLKELEQGLAQLSDRHQLAFSAACCERALPALRGLDQSDPRIEEMVSSDLLIRNELEKQAQDARTLASQRDLTARFLESFRAQAAESGYVSLPIVKSVDESERR